MAGNLVGDHDIVEGLPTARFENGTPRDDKLAARQRADGILEAWFLDRRQIAQRTQVEPQERHAGIAMYGRKHRAISPQDNHRHAIRATHKVLRTAQHLKADRTRKCRQPSANRIRARLVAIDVERDPCDMRPRAHAISCDRCRHRRMPPRDPP